MIVKGKVTGNIRASGRIEMHASARIEGDVLTPTLVMHEGAQFEGRCSMGSPESGTKPKPAPAASER